MSPGGLPPEVATNLQQALVNIAAELAGPHKPSYTIDGKTMDWNGYYAMLTARYKDIEGMLQRAGGPFEIRSYGVT